MFKKSAKMTLSAIVMCLALVSGANALTINKSITIGAGEVTDGQSTINGSISVGDGAKIDGSLDTVNGSIRVGNEVSASDIETVNGSIKAGTKLNARNVETVNGAIHLGAGSNIDGDVETVNGLIQLAKGTTVARAVSTVNGALEFDGSRVSGDVSTVNGGVTLENGAVIEGSLTVKKPGGLFNKNRDRKKPKIVIGPGSKVVGGIILEREVELFISDKAEVGGVSGEMSLEDAVRFSGKQP